MILNADVVDELRRKRGTLPISTPCHGVWRSAPQVLCNSTVSCHKM